MSESVYYGVLLTLLAYTLGLWIRRKTRLALLNPILLGVLGVIGANALTGVSYEAYNQGGQYLTWLLTPATVCLAVPLYEQLPLLKKHCQAVLSGITAGVVAGLAGVWALCLAFGLNHELYATLLPKSVTSAIGLGLSQELGGLPSLTVAIIICCGLMGNMLAEPFFKLIRVSDPIAQGLAMGTASHALGTARAIEMGPVEGAMSSLAIAAAGVMTVAGATIMGYLI